MGCERFGIVGSGNGIRKNPALVSVAEKIFRGELKVPEYTEEAACGAALFALVACGAFTLFEVKKLIKYEDR
jgi:sedoheptulokinase